MNVANAGEITLLAGMSHFTPAEDGNWYQQPFPHKLNLNSGSYGVRYDTKQYWKGESFAIGYMNLGTVTSWSRSDGHDAMRPDDGGYDHITKKCNGTCLPLSTWYGRGTVQGIFGAVTQHYGGFSTDLGVYVYRPTFVMHIPDYVGSRDCEPFDLTVQHDPRIKTGLMVGVGYQVDHASIRVSIWPTSTAGDAFPAVYNKWTYNVSVGYSL